MNRRRLLLATASVGILVLVLIAADKKPAGKLLVLDWAGKSSLAKPPVAVLIEFGHKDTAPTNWSGTATVTGAKVVHREGYRFRPKDGDQLTDPDGWKSSSHRGLRVPARQPALQRVEPLATVGVVLHLADVQPDAALNLDLTGDEKAQVGVPLKDVLTGKPQPIRDGRGVVRLVSTALPLATGKTEDDFPAACYGPDGTLWVAWVGYHVKDDTRRIEQKPLQQQPADFKAYHMPEFGDQLFVKYYKDGKWSEPIAVTDDKQDIVGCAIATMADKILVTHSAYQDGRYRVQFRTLMRNPIPDGKPEWTFRIGAEKEPVLDKRLSHLFPVMATSRPDILRYGAMELNVAGTDRWTRSITVGPDGRFAISWDRYNNEDFDVVAQVSTETDPPFAKSIANSSRFEARPSVAYDPAGRLWIAYEEGPELWGKDYGALDDADGQPLYSSRSVRVVCLENGKLLRPVAELPTSNVAAPKMPYNGPAYEKGARNSNPKIGIDGKGRVWLTYRQKFGTRYSSHPGSYWLTYARRLDGDAWSEPIELHHSDGLLDHRPVLLPHKDGGLLVVHNTDGRYTTPEMIDNDLYLSHIDLPGEPKEPKLVAHDPGTKNPKLVERHKKEMEAVQRIRNYRVEAGGKKYQLLRGEFHRHTELSWDGGPDGSLEDMFRYGIDAANFDWIANGDHDNGAGREYSWWLVQKFTDAYHVPGRFTPLFGYERSVGYPHGHRNVLFAQRGVRTLPRLAEPDPAKRVAGIHADDTKMLYRYLKELNGICASHTSATSMGTDWRDHDPKVEPLVEIYQGDRMSYEMQEAPRAGYDPRSGKAPANIAGWYPDGFIDHALRDKGHRLGFQASSDHWSTHISYCIVLAEKHDRESILDAMRQRHVYAATDDIICNVRSGPHLMGDEFQSSGAPEFQIHITGTADLASVEVLKDSKVVATLKTGGRECKQSWTDPTPTDGVHYYYVRVRQTDGELAWTSPMWVDYRK